MDERAYARYMADVAYFITQLEQNPTSKYFMPVALAYNKMEKYDQSISVCKAALEKFPTYCPVKTLLAEAYVYKGEIALAKDLLFDVVTEDPDNYKALRLLGTIYKSSDETGEALKYFKAAYIRAPEDETLKRIIEEMGASVAPEDLFDEYMKKANDSAWASGEDKSRRDIEQHIRSAEVMMSDLVSTSDITDDIRDTEQTDGGGDAAAGNMISESELNKLITGASLGKEPENLKQAEPPVIPESNTIDIEDEIENAGDYSQLTKILDIQAGEDLKASDTLSATSADIDGKDLWDTLDETSSNDKPEEEIFVPNDSMFENGQNNISMPQLQMAVQNDNVLPEDVEQSFAKARKVINTSALDKPVIAAAQSLEVPKVAEELEIPSAVPKKEERSTTPFGERQDGATFANDKSPIKFTLEDILGDDTPDIISDIKIADLNTFGQSAPFVQRDILDEILAASDAADSKGETKELTHETSNIPASVTADSKGEMKELTHETSNIPASVTAYSKGETKELTHETSNIPASVTTDSKGETKEFTHETSNIPASVTADSEGGTKELTHETSNIPASVTTDSEGETKELTHETSNIPASVTADSKGETKELTHEAFNFSDMNNQKNDKTDELPHLDAFDSDEEISADNITADEQEKLKETTKDRLLKLQSQLAKLKKG